METKNITYSAVFSAIFIILSIIAISTGIAYTLFLDIIVPIYICIVFFKLDRKYTILMALASLLIVFFILGDVVSAIWMIQGMAIGFICTLFINKNSYIFDDFLYASIMATFIIIFIDIYFSTLTGYSMIKDSEEILKTFISTMNSINPSLVLPEYFSSLVIYISVATVPVGTVIIVYLGTMIIGSKLNILDKNTRRKYNIIKGFKNYGALLCCSENAYRFSLIYILITECIKKFNINISMDYIRVVIMSGEIICLYFIVKDSISFFTKYIMIKNKSKALYNISFILSMYLLLVNFKVMLVFLVISSCIINRKMNLREKQIKVLNNALC